MFTFSGKDITFRSSLPDAMAMHLPREACIALSGAPDGATVHAGMEGGFAFLEVEHSVIVEMRRQLFFLPTGEMDLHNQRIRLSASARGTRFLARSIQQQIAGIDELGSHSSLKVGRFSSVVVRRGYPEGRENHDEDPDLGYWLLPRLGFDTPFPGDRELLVANFPHLSPKSLALVVEDKDASKWWLEVGHGYHFTLKFDLVAGSRSRAVLRRYTGPLST